MPKVMSTLLDWKPEYLPEIEAQYPKKGCGECNNEYWYGDVFWNVFYTAGPELLGYTPRKRCTTRKCRCPSAAPVGRRSQPRELDTFGWVNEWSGGVCGWGRWVINYSALNMILGLLTVNISSSTTSNTQGYPTAQHMHNLIQCHLSKLVNED